MEAHILSMTTQEATAALELQEAGAVLVHQADVVAAATTPAATTTQWATLLAASTVTAAAEDMADRGGAA